MTTRGCAFLLVYFLFFLYGCESSTNESHVVEIEGKTRVARAIVDGVEVPSSKYSQTGVIKYGSGCSAVLLNGGWALTAAHCGDYESVSCGSIESTVVGRWNHPSYSLGGNPIQDDSVDVALLKLGAFCDTTRPNGTSWIGFSRPIYNGSMGSAVHDDVISIWGMGSGTLEWAASSVDETTPSTLFVEDPYLFNTHGGDSGGPWFHATDDLYGADAQNYVIYGIHFGHIACPGPGGWFCDFPEGIVATKAAAFRTWVASAMGPPPLHPALIATAVLGP